MNNIEVQNLPYRLNVGIVLLNKEKNIFAGKRIDYHHSDAWQMPQGGIDKGEDPQSAALRELEEETGISQMSVEIVTSSKEWLSYDLPLDLVPKLWGARYRGQKQKWFLMNFVGAENNINISTDDPEFSNWRWLSPSELIKNIVPFKVDVYKKVISEFSRYL